MPLHQHDKYDKCLKYIIDVSISRIIKFTGTYVN